MTKPARPAQRTTPSRGSRGPKRQATGSRARRDTPEHGHRDRRDADQAARMLVLTVPGLAPVLREELASIPGVRVTDSGHDGRADVVLCTVQPRARRAVLRVRTAEDVLVECGRTRRADGDRAPWIGQRLWRPSRVDRALGHLSAVSVGLPARTSFRVVARVLTERAFRRTELRDQIVTTIRRDRTRWRVADPARLEIWVLEYAPGRFVAGLRASDESMRQHQGRVRERGAALRPAVAAAMIARAGPGDPDSVDLLLDPCCGSGTILGEASESGWSVCGRDIDPAAIRVSQRNVPGADLAVGDARALDLGDGVVRACVANLPFGQQCQVPGDPASWLTDVLGELARVTAPDGRVVLLAPQIPRSRTPASLRLRERHRLRLLGTTTTMWIYQRD